MAKKVAKKDLKTGSPRLHALKILDEILSKPANMKKLRAGLQEYLDDEPVLFYRYLIKPSAEKELIIDPNTGDIRGDIQILFADLTGMENANSSSKETKTSEKPKA